MKIKSNIKKVAIILLLIVCVILGEILGYNRAKKEIEVYDENNKNEINVFLTRNEINYILLEDIDSYFEIYEGLSGDPEIARVILFFALEYNVPVNLAFALCKKESRFDPNAINYNSTSEDRGLFQLNSKYHTLNDWFDIMENTERSMVVLSEKYKEYGKWEFALLAYNVGSISHTGPRSVKYLGDILDTEIELDETFNKIFRNLYITEIEKMR